MIYCPGCGTANRDGSRFCNECGTKMPTMTSSLCPTCGTPNPPHSLFCEKCGTRLIASLTEEPEESEAATPTVVVPKGLSLPTKPVSTPESAASTAPTKSEEEEPPDWMQAVQAGGATAELDRAQPATPDRPVSGAEEVPAWLTGLGTGGEALAEEKKPATDDLLPEWTQRFRTLPETDQPAVAEEDEVPDWLKVLGTTGRLPSDQLPPVPGAATPTSAEEKPAWLSNVPALTSGDFGSATPAAEAEELPEWLKEHPQFEEPAPAAELPPPPPVVEAKPVADAMPDWLRDLRPAASITDEALPDWLDELGVEEEPAPESQALATGDSSLDWLSQLGATAPEAPLDQSTAPTESVTPDWMSSFRSAEPAAESMPEEEGVPDWLTGLGMAAPEAAAVDADQSKPEAQPLAEPVPASKPVTDWLASLRQAAPEMEEEPAQAAGEEEAAEIPEWLRESGAAPQAIGGPQPDEQEIPAWARESGASEPPTAAQPEEEGLPDWLKDSGMAAAGAAAISAAQAELEAEPVPETKPVTDWLSSLRRATPEMEEEPAQAEEAAEIPEWLREPGVSEPQPAAEPESEEGIPDWLKGIGMAAPGAAAVDADQPKPEAEPLAEPAPDSQPVTDWLANLQRATPAMEEEPAQAEEEIPEWLRESGAVPQAIGGPQTYEQEVPEWVRSASEPSAAAQPEDEGVPDWLSSLRQAAPEMEAKPAQAEEESVPDWLQGLGMAEAGAAQVEPEAEPVPASKPVTDWLVSLRQAAPEMEAEQAAEEEAAEIPEWLRETGAAPQAIGEPQPGEPEIPAWARESGAGAGVSEAPAAAQAEEEGVPDWLKGLGATTAGAAALTTAPRRAEPPAEVEVPDWLREAEPTPSVASGDFGPVETPIEATAEGEVPEWLRDLRPTAAIAPAEPEEVAEEPEPPEEAEEPEPETPSDVSSAKAAIAGAAAAATPGAVKGTKAEAALAPAEMPSWLKELRQEQEAAQSTIQVPPAEAAELTQAEIPAWLEALRPKGQPPTPLAAEIPSEAEGPLAGIANALPPALLMGQVQGAPMKLQFETSAEDLARAGVLKELLGQPTVAPASLEQFVVKGSAVRRRALRWTMAALFIFVLLIPFPFGVDLNQLLHTNVLPNVQTLVVPAAVKSTADRIKALPQNATVLVVFDYDAAQAGEMNRVAKVLLQGLTARNAQIEIASLNPQGTSLAQLVMKEIPDIQQVADLGYAPGQANGVQDLLARRGDVKLIVDFAASADTVRWWAEQMKASNLQIPFIAGVSAGAETLTMPYMQSKQVAGVVSGLPGALAFLKETKEMGLIKSYPPEDQFTNQVALDGISLANYTLAVLIIIGLIAALFGGSGRRSRS